MLAKILYYILILPASLLPMSFLYGFSKVFLLLVYNIFGYRKEVVYTNLRNAFPEKSESEIKLIAKKFYRHFGQISAEGIKGFTISKKNLLSRYKVTNPEIVEQFYKEGKSVLLVSGHYGNWEFMVQSLNLHFSHQGTGVGKPITSDGFGRIMNKSRIRFGMEIWDHSNVRQEIKTHLENKTPFCCMLLADQSTSNTDRSFWIRFLNQDTPVLFGPEKLAQTHDLPIIYYDVVKVKPGYYELTLKLVSLYPKEEAYGDITFKHNKMLEELIMNKPEYWLWSHKRWKHSAQSEKYEVRV
jgi:KDO2-lipid IV(A) lauroyltransferase